MKEKIFGGIFGLCVADALGVPVEFNSRDSLRDKPVIGMRGYGTWNQPKGTWSDDTSMTLGLLDSLQNGLDYDDIMGKFLSWWKDAEYTPHGEVFDVGFATSKAIERYQNGVEPLQCGGDLETDNGNGALMRILPIAFYLQRNKREKAEAFEIIHNVCSLTHAHRRSHIACGMYVSIAIQLMLQEGEVLEIVQNGLADAYEYYKSQSKYTDELQHYERIFDVGFQMLEEHEIRSSGYVVDTLEAALWCLITTDSYRDCVLKAVNLGSDTDTVGAVAGGLAGIYYGYDAIPQEWLEQIARRDYIERLAFLTCYDAVVSL
jgi:ADP-ribosylglycohydrolase